ncbi:hypothetical protein [Pleomorphovibrio marinus]|nr:hypothetical protein [Pleomorphovibrio marinus]
MKSSLPTGPGRTVLRGSQGMAQAINSGMIIVATGMLLGMDSLVGNDND